jgi:hypothetical protein
MWLNKINSTAAKLAEANLNAHNFKKVAVASSTLCTVTVIGCAYLFIAKNQS